jgi:CheY-like chemotaxis protein
MRERDAAEGGIMRGDPKANVLIVDNDDRMLWKYQEMLENAGFRTCATWSGHEALGLLRSGGFDVLLVDDYLPDLHSHDFLERVNRLSIQPAVVVMHSSPAKPGDLQCYASLGVSEVIDKADAARVCRAVSACGVEQPLARKHVN